MVDQETAWYCEDCDWKSSKVSLTDPIEHETRNPKHKVNPTAKTALAWLGKI
jgi:hypothetical protein